MNVYNTIYMHIHVNTCTHIGEHRTSMLYDINRYIQLKSDDILNVIYYTCLYVYNFYYYIHSIINVNINNIYIYNYLHTR